jgi:Family of unknown function (DUF5522)
MSLQLIEGEDYIVLPDGRLVFTAKYLLHRGFCCGKGCKNCPYEYKNVPQPQRDILLNKRNENTPTN